jgi:hypothetical protein
MTRERFGGVTAGGAGFFMGCPFTGRRSASIAHGPGRSGRLGHRKDYGWRTGRWSRISSPSLFMPATRGRAADSSKNVVGSVPEGRRQTGLGGGNSFSSSPQRLWWQIRTPSNRSRARLRARRLRSSAGRGDRGVNGVMFEGESTEPDEEMAERRGSMGGRLRSIIGSPFVKRIRLDRTWVRTIRSAGPP